MPVINQGNKKYLKVYFVKSQCRVSKVCGLNDVERNKRSVESGKEFPDVCVNTLRPAVRHPSIYFFIPTCTRLFLLHYSSCMFACFFASSNTPK